MKKHYFDLPTRRKRQKMRNKIDQQRRKDFCRKNTESKRHLSYKKDNRE